MSENFLRSQKQEENISEYFSDLEIGKINKKH